jgi:hypothetical protein
MSTTLRILSFFATLVAVVVFYSLIGRLEILEERKDDLIYELEKEEPNQERIEKTKEFIALLEKRFDPRSQIITGIVSIVLSFLLSGAARYLKRKSISSRRSQLRGLPPPPREDSTFAIK